MNVVKIRLRKPRRVFSFLCSELPLKRDESCIVLSDRGEEIGTCILPPEPCPAEMQKRFSMKVLRRVTEKDQRDCAYIEGEEKKALEICQKKVRGRKLPMKLVDVEVTLDKKKIIFYFTADDRVDFRELVRDLAHDLRARIEMRHIQVRDEAKMVGGLGGCGRELCCSSWMNEFRPISMRMAKAQNLSLNPSKISGQCGRLLCCLSYENDQYEAMRKKARQEIKDRQEKAASRAALNTAPATAGEAKQEPRSGDERSEKTDTQPSSETPPKGESPPSRGARDRGRNNEKRRESARRQGESRVGEFDTPGKVVDPSDTKPSEAAPTAATEEQNSEKKPGRRPRRNRKRKRGPRPESNDGAKS